MTKKMALRRIPISVLLRKLLTLYKMNNPRNDGAEKQAKRAIYRNHVVDNNLISFIIITIIIIKHKNNRYIK